MAGGKRANAGRMIKGWSGVFKGMGSLLRRYPKPLVEKLDALKEQEAHILDIIKVLETVHSHNFNDFAQIQERQKAKILAYLKDIKTATVQQIQAVLSDLPIYLIAALCKDLAADQKIVWEEVGIWEDSRATLFSSRIGKIREQLKQATTENQKLFELAHQENKRLKQEIACAHKEINDLKYKLQGSPRHPVTLDG